MVMPETFGTAPLYDVHPLVKSYAGSRWPVSTVKNYEENQVSGSHKRDRKGDTCCCTNRSDQPKSQYQKEYAEIAMPYRIRSDGGEYLKRGSIRELLERNMQSLGRSHRSAKKRSGRKIL